MVFGVAIASVGQMHCTTGCQKLGKKKTSCFFRNPPWRSETEETQQQLPHKIPVSEIQQHHMSSPAIDTHVFSKEGAGSGISAHQMRPLCRPVCLSIR